MAFLDCSGWCDLDVFAAVLLLFDMVAAEQLRLTGASASRTSLERHSVTAHIKSKPYHVARRPPYPVANIAQNRQGLLLCMKTSLAARKLRMSAPGFPESQIADMLSTYPVECGENTTRYGHVLLLERVYQLYEDTASPVAKSPLLLCTATCMGLAQPLKQIARTPASLENQVIVCLRSVIC